MKLDKLKLITFSVGCGTSYKLAPAGDTDYSPKPQGNGKSRLATKAEEIVHNTVDQEELKDLASAFQDSRGEATNENTVIFEYEPSGENDNNNKEPSSQENGNNSETSSDNNQSQKKSNNQSGDTTWLRGTLKFSRKGSYRVWDTVTTDKENIKFYHSSQKRPIK